VRFEKLNYLGVLLGNLESCLVFGVSEFHTYVKEYLYYLYVALLSGSHHRCAPLNVLDFQLGSLVHQVHNNVLVSVLSRQVHGSLAVLRLPTDASACHH